MFKRRMLWLFVIPLIFPNGCRFARPILKEQTQDLGRFEYRHAAEGKEGVVIAAPHGRTDPDSDRLARAISDKTGAGLVIAYGFKSKRLSVTQPVVRPHRYLPPNTPFQSRSVFTQFRTILLKSAEGDLNLYVGVHRSTADNATDLIEVATGGLTFEQASALKDAYTKIRDNLTEGKEFPRLPMVIEPLDRILWRVSGVKHHGVLLIAERGLNLRLPPMAFSSPAQEIYTEILSRWTDRVIEILRENPLGLPQIQVRLVDLGRFELIESRKGVPGVVIGAPHGSFDAYTAEMAKQLSYHTGLATVIAKGFTPTQAGGRRINVNRPTEKTFPSERPELHSQRARRVYDTFKNLVLKASAGALNLYVDIHQYNTDSKVQVATVGVSREEAKIIKALYHEIRDRILSGESDIPVVEFLIEPLDEIEISAWAAKTDGILRLAKKSLHIELPGHKVLATEGAREAYRSIFSALLCKIVPILISTADGQVAKQSLR